MFPEFLRCLLFLLLTFGPAWALVETLRAGSVRERLHGQLIVSSWCLGIGWLGIACVDTLTGTFAPAYGLVLALPAAILIAARWRHRRATRPPSSP